MNKIVSALKASAAVALAAVAAQAYAATGDVSKGTIAVSPQQVAKNSAAYVTVTAFDADGNQVSGLTPVASVSPSFAASVGKFLPCDSAEGREACAAAGNGMEGLAGAYVAKVTSKDVEGEATVGVYLPGKYFSAALTVGDASAKAAPVSSEAAPKASEAKAGGGAKGLAFAALMLAAAAVPAAALALLARRGNSN